jgi:hypothetical protein
MNTIKSGKTWAQILVLLAIVLFNFGPHGLSAAQAQVTCYTLTIAASPVAGGTVTPNPPPNCGSQYEQGTVVTLTASPNAGYIFWLWTGAAILPTTSSNPGTVTMDSDKSVTGNFVLKPPHDDFGNAKSFSGLPYEDLNVDVRGATTQSINFPFGADPDNVGPCELGIRLNQGNKTVWYQYTPNETQTTTVDTISSTYDTILGVWTGTQDNLSLVACNDEGPGGASLVSFLASAGTTYYIQVGEYNGTEGGTPGGNLGGILNLHVGTGPIFADVPTDYWARRWIESIYLAGITGGCGTSPLIYCPAATVNRDQMAVFLLRGIHGRNYGPPPVGASTGFTDVPTNYWAAAWIKQLAAEGITSGCGSGIYCPDSPVSRAQMAVFLLKSKYGILYSPPPVGASTGFTDVPTNYWAAAWIKQLVTEGITSGCGSGIYCPEDLVTRAQMAIFLQRTFSLPLP